MIATMASPAAYRKWVLGVWLAGSTLYWATIWRRHRALVSSLGELKTQPDGSLRAVTRCEPMLFGILRPRIVLPPDFYETYGPNERAMVIAHERAHWLRRDPQFNAVAALWLSLSWFNPLMHWAHRLFRFDQELACDATVLAMPGTTRRGYAEALLKTQLTTDLARNRTMLGCLWHSFHPLTERIQILRRPLPGELRHRAGLGLMIACILSGCYAVRTTQSQAAQGRAEGPLIAVNIKAFVNGAEVLPAAGSPSDWNVLVHSGGQFGFGSPKNWVNCTTQLAPGTDGNIFFSCRLTREGNVLATPSMLVRDGEPASVAASDRRTDRAIACSSMPQPARGALRPFPPHRQCTVLVASRPSSSSG